ncbi:hypothetical protein M6D93_01590 [Jatrophihabitans telluris]|uniref:Uncharacterized protein n=1 Tax=Jatrophihabitans telluris TaxID=2038343 RepID=A0ABY4QZE8_9ACTN|nr:hypothetical protein [Jatrophihabitans telluris]UQX88708.1 hypothetical protein M6D93_01590 [Jatrophihabitans telluris]
MPDIDDLIRTTMREHAPDDIAMLTIPKSADRVTRSIAHSWLAPVAVAVAVAAVSAAVIVAVRATVETANSTSATATIHGTPPASALSEPKSGQLDPSASVTDTAPTPTKGGPPPITPGPNGTITPTLGEINATDIDPYIAKVITPINGWGVECDGINYVIWAGSNSGRSAIVVSPWSTAPFRLILGPEVASTLRVTDMNCETATLTSPQHKTYHYDLTTRTLR